jgi:hypothetical protein
MGLFSFFNQFNNTSDIIDVVNNLTLILMKIRDKKISYENLCCSNIPKTLRNLFFEFFTNFIKETTSKTSSANSHISLQNFTEILIHRYDLPFFIPIVSFIYINRILRIPNATAILSEFTPNRLTAVAIIIASKYYLEDTIYIKNSKWISKVCMGLFKTGELNSLESLFLRSIDYHINVSYLEWKEYLERIDNGLHELKLKYNKLSCKELKNKSNINVNNNNINNLNNSSNNNLKNNNISSIIQPLKKENPIKNVKQLFSLLDSHILNNDQLISYDPSLEPNFSVLYNIFESPSNSTFSSPQPNYIHNSEIQKIKENIDTNGQSIQNNHNASSSTYNDEIMEEDELIIEGNRKKRTRIKRKNQNYQYSGILTPPSSSSSSSSQSIYASKVNKSNIDNNVAIRNCENEEEKNGNPSSDIEGFSNNNNTLTTEITMNSSLSPSHHPSTQSSHASLVNIDINSNTSSGLNFNNSKDRQSMIFTPNSQLKTNTLSSLYQHNPDLKNALENYSITGRLTAGHSNHYAGNRYHPFSRQNRNVPTEEKRNGLPLFSPIKSLDKPMTAISPYVCSLLNKHSMTKSFNKSNNSSENSDDQSDMFVSPIPNGNRRTNTIRSFNIHDSDDEKMKKNPNQMSVEDIASKYSISKSKNTREYNGNNSNSNNNNNKDRFHKTSGRTSLSYTSRNRKHRRSLSTSKNTTASSPNSSFTSSTQRSNTTSFNDTNLGLGISKKSKLISKNTKFNIPKTKNQKLITSYLTTMMESQPDSQSHQIPSTPHSTAKIANPNITFLKRFPSITKLLNKFNVRKEKKNIS